MAITALDANGVQQTIETLPTAGRKSAATSLPVVNSNEDKAVADAMAASLVSILAKITADPATQTTLAAVLAKLPSVGTAGSSASNVLSVQGIASGTALPVSGPLTDAQLAARNLATSALQTSLNTLVGAQSAAAWTSGDGTLISLLKAIATSAISTAPTSVSVLSSEFETVAASQTDQILGTTGAIGDTIEGLLVIPSSTTVGAISIENGSTNITVYAGGTVGADLKPFFIPLYGIAATTATGWEVTTGAGASVLAFGQFT